MNQYIKTYIIYFFIFISLLIAFNWAVDPYGIQTHHLISIEKKPAAQTHVRLSKPYLVTQIKPQTIILGSSRAAVGLNPEHSSFIHLPVFNLGIDGANMREIYYNFLHAYHVGNLKQVILALDFMSFNINMEDKPGFSLHRLKTTENKITFETEIFSHYTSYQVTKDSVKTLLSKFDPTLSSMNGSGLTLEDSLYTYRQTFGGHYNTTVISEKSHINVVWLPPKLPEYSFHNPQSSKSTMNYLGKILSLCHKNNIHVIAFFSPTHVRHRVLISKMGLWETYQSWKTQVIQENHAQALKHNKQTYDIWDFTSINPITTESFPEQDNISHEMTWYWESSHYKQQLGNVILSQIFSQNPTIKYPEEFGYLVNIDNIDMKLSTENKEYDTYIVNNNHIAKELSDLIKNEHQLS